MNAERRFRVGLVGAGYVSEFHVEALRRIPGVELVGVADLDRSRAQGIGERFGLPVVRSSLDELVRDGGLDAVHILTPPASHVTPALRALELGCHVLVEKPLATAVEDCDRLALAAERAGRHLGVVHSYLHDPFIARALALVRQGLIGDVVSMDYFRSSQYPPWPGGPVPPQYRDGGYPFRDLGVHGLYLMEAFLGGIEDATAQFGSRGDGDALVRYDEWRVLLRCARGTGHMHLSFNVQPLQHILYLQGTRGTLRADVFSMFVTHRRRSRLPSLADRVLGPLKEAWHVGTQVPWNVGRYVTGSLWRYHGLQALVAEFYARLAAGDAPPFTARSVRSVVEWTERLARPADDAKRAWLSSFPRELSAPILVTGATGFIGRHLVERLLDSGERVRLLARREPAPEVLRHPAVEIVQGDLGDSEAVERAVAGTRLVYHLGATMRGDAGAFDRGTVGGTRHVVESVLRHRARLVYVSSLSVLHMAAIRPTRPITEAFDLEPHPERRGHYTRTKLEAERIVLDAVRERGLRAVIVRPGLVFGPGQPVITSQVGFSVGPRVLILGDGTVPLPLVYVEDVVDALLNASASSTFDGSIFHVVDPTPITQKDLASRYLESRGLRPRIVRLPIPLVYGLAFFADRVFRLLGRASPISVYRVKSSMARLAFDSAASERDLHWKPRVGTEEGLVRTLARVGSSSNA